MARRGRGEGTVYRRADGRWEAAFAFGGRRQRYVARSQRDVRIKLLAARRALGWSKELSSRVPASGLRRI
jgi:hypothetical protein